MKTHKIAKILSDLAQALRTAPDQTLEELTSGGQHRLPLDPASIPVALSTLVALADVDKAQWQSLIQECRFPIDIRPRDASRDILGKLLKHLEQNPEARNRLTNATPRGRSETSPELMRALQFLLKT